MNTHNDFAAKMREKRAERARAVRMSDATVIDSAWQRTYQYIYQQFGKPSNEIRDGENYFMSWNGTGEVPMLVIDLGVVYKAMKSPTRRHAVQTLIRQHELWLSAKTPYTFVVCVPSEDYVDFAPLERWAQAGELPVVKTFNDPKEKERVLFFARSNGTTDWFGRETKTRPVVTIEIP